MMLAGCTKSAQDAAAKLISHELAIVTPLADGIINSGNKAAFPIGGTCKVDGVSVTWVAEDDLATPTSLTGTLDCASNVWSGTPDLHTLDEGVVNLTVTQVEAVGTTASATVGLVKNTTTPTLAVDDPAVGSWINSTNKASVAVTGTCSENGQLVSFTAGATGTSVTCASGVWSQNLDFSANSSEGAVSITVSHVNATGNSSTATGSFQKDATSPVAPTTITIGTLPNSLEVTPILNFSGQSDAGSSIDLVQVKLVSETPDTVVSSYASSTTGAGLSGLTLDHSKTYHFVLRSKDVAGNYSSEVTSPSFIPTFAAVTSTLASSATSPTNSASVAVTVTFNVAVTGLVEADFASGLTNATIDPSSLSGTGTSYTFNLVPTVDGSFSVNLPAGSAIDGSSNNNLVSNTLSFVSDTTAPTVAITSPSASAYINGASVASFAVSGTCSEEGRSVTIAGSASGTATCTSSAWNLNLDFTAASDGAVGITASQSDVAGNSSTPSALSLNKDVVAPALTITTPASNPATVTSSNFPVGGACETSVTVAYTIGSISSSTACTAGAWSASVNLSTLNNGDYVFTAIQLDTANNQTTVTENVTKAVRPTVALTFTTPSVLQGYSDVNTHTTNITATFSTAVTGFDSADISVVGGTVSPSVTAVSGTVYTFDVAWTASKGTITVADAAADDVNVALVKSTATSLKLVSFNDDIKPLLNAPFSGTVGGVATTNNASCIYCHSGGTAIQRNDVFTNQVSPITNLCFATGSATDACTGTVATFPRKDLNFAPVSTQAGWPTSAPWALPSIEYAGITKFWTQAAGTTNAPVANTYNLVDLVEFKPAQSRLYLKLSAGGTFTDNAGTTNTTSVVISGNMPSTSGTAAGVNYRKNTVRASVDQLKLVSDWISQGVKDN
jgi:hypothetical protein